MSEEAEGTIFEGEELLEEGAESDRGMSQLKSAAEVALEQSRGAVKECTDLITGRAL